MIRGVLLLAVAARGANAESGLIFRNGLTYELLAVDLDARRGGRRRLVEEIEVLQAARVLEQPRLRRRPKVVDVVPAPSEEA